MQIAQKINYRYEIHRRDNQNLLSLHTERDICIGEAPVVSNDRKDTKRAIQVIIKNAFEDGHSGIKYTVIGGDSEKPVRGSYFSQKAVKHIKEAPRKWARHKIRKAKKSKGLRLLSFVGLMAGTAVFFRDSIPAHGAIDNRVFDAYDRELGHVDTLGYAFTDTLSAIRAYSLWDAGIDTAYANPRIRDGKNYNEIILEAVGVQAPSKREVLEFNVPQIKDTLDAAKTSARTSTRRDGTSTNN